MLLPSRTPVSVAGIWAGWADAGRDAHLYVSRCTDPEPTHFGVCQSAGVFPLNGRVLVVVGEHVAGWVIAGWAVPWPTLLPAAIALQAVLTVMSWVIETSCDLGAAFTAGPARMLEALTRASQAADAACAARPAWPAISALTWITGPAHPPFPVRRALIRVLIRHQADTTV